MKNNLSIISLCLAAAIWLAGCALYDKPAKPSSADEKHGHGDTSQADNRYYHFMAAQILQKRGDLDAALAHLKQAIQADPHSAYLQMELAILYIQKKENAKALGILGKIVERHPENVNALILLGKLSQSLDKDEAAKAAYEKVLAIDPKQEEVYLILGGMYLQEDQLERALKTYRQLLKNFPRSYAGYFFIGKVYAMQGKLKDAEKKFIKTLELNPGLEEPRLELLDIYKKTGNKKKVIELYTDLLQKNPRNIQAAMGLGLYYHENGRQQASQKLFADLGVRSIEETDIVGAVVKLYLDSKRYQDAVVVLEGMLKGVPGNSDLCYLAGIAYDGKGDQDTAISYYKKVMPDSRFYKDAVIQTAFLYQEQGKIEQAISYLEGVVADTPDSPEFFLYLGSFYEEAEQYRKAENVLKQGLKVASDNPKLHFRLGVLYDKWGKKQASIAQMKAVIGLDPKHANALNYLGYTYAEMGENLDEAERLIKAALKEKPDDGYITDSLGWVYYKKKLYTKALKYLEIAVSIVPDDPTILEHLGDVYLALSNKQKALEFYRRSLSKKEKDKGDLEKKIQGLMGGE
jgi:tetratricopeptide (TPR) repeat protein